MKNSVVASIIFFSVSCLAMESRNDIIDSILKDKPELKLIQDGETILHLASRAQHIDIIDLLLKAGCNINVEDTFQNKPLHHAASNNPAIIEFLLGKGALIDEPNSYGQTALISAVIAGQVRSVEKLASQSTLSLMDCTKRTACKYAQHILERMKEKFETCTSSPDEQKALIKNIEDFTQICSILRVQEDDISQRFCSSQTVHSCIRLAWVALALSSVWLTYSICT